MESRSAQLKQIRPLITKAKVDLTTSSEESFQNATLRPILKFQNDLFVSGF